MDNGPNVTTFLSFSPANIHADQLVQSVNPPDEYFTLPSPEYGAKPLNPIPQQVFYSHLPLCSQSSLKPVYSNNAFGIIQNDDEIDSKIISLGISNPSPPNITNTTDTFVNYPLTPKTPHAKFSPELPLPTTPPPAINFEPIIFELPPQQVDYSEQADYCYAQGHYWLHFARPRNPDLASECFVMAANLGSVRGKYQVAYCFQHGIGFAKDEKKAVDTYLEIVSMHPQHSPSLCQLGVCFQYGIGVEVNGPRAVNYYKDATYLGNVNAMFNLAYCFRRGVGTALNPQGAFNLYYQLANQGDPQGMKLLGDCKYYGIGTPKDEAEALKWFRQASECDFYWGGKMRYAMALLEIAAINPNPNHNREAFRLINEVCQNFLLCPGPNKLMLGKCYHFGIGCTPDLQMALYWYQQALQSYFMPVPVQECKRLIDDIRTHHEFPITPVIIKREQIVVDHSNVKAVSNFSIQ